MHLHWLWVVDARRRTAAVWPIWHRPLAVTVGVLFLAVYTSACRMAIDAASDTSRQARDAGTIRGTLRGPEHLTPVDGRVVEIINIDTQERQSVTTDTAGAFSLRVKAGKYRVDLPLRDGETLIRQPGVVHLARPGAATHVNFVIGTVRVSRPRAPTYRTDDGLGSPIA